MGFIYKITNLKSRKCYIGETKEENPETRWKGHLQAMARGKGCPALRDAIQKHGIENFKFEVLIICFDNDRFEYEKEYIKKYNSMVPNGYNILEGGIGGAGFKGKKHTEDAIEKIKTSLKNIVIDPKDKEMRITKIKETMKKVDISGKVKSSEKYKKALEEGRVGGGSGSTQKLEVREKISTSLKEYYKKTTDWKEVNIEKHRESMAKAVGRSVSQFDLDGTLIATFKSIAEANRHTGVSKGGIGFVLKGTHKTAGGFIWKSNS
jgi:group I intron endonuclease